MMWSAFVLGLLGSVHCLAMCGPLVMTLNSKKRQSGMDKVYYNAGRIFTYCILGALAGIFGTGIKWMVGQQFVSIFSGSLIIIGLILTWTGIKGKYLRLPGILTRVKQLLSKMLQGRSINMWWFGMYNGLLPCGLTYVALAASVSAGSYLESVLFMSLFGLGTSPMLWMIVSGFQRISFKWVSANKLVTGFTWILAILLIIRGLGLGVPYFSPDTEHRHEAHLSIEK